ncbi:MAG: hypothetical protein ACT452_03685 [Microthrixaceae bacterium]
MNVRFLAATAAVLAGLTSVASASARAEDTHADAGVTMIDVGTFDASAGYLGCVESYQVRSVWCFVVESDADQVTVTAVRTTSNDGPASTRTVLAAGAFVFEERAELGGTVLRAHLVADVDAIGTVDIVVTSDPLASHTAGSEHCISPLTYELQSPDMGLHTVAAVTGTVDGRAVAPAGGTYDDTCAVLTAEQTTGTWATMPLPSLRPLDGL